MRRGGLFLVHREWERRKGKEKGKGEGKRGMGKIIHWIRWDGKGRDEIG